MREAELSQRSGFQFEIIKLNLIANGTLVSVALSNVGVGTGVTVACPFISFVLFLLWFHHALAIRTHSDPSLHTARYVDRPGLHALRKLSFSISMFGNFVLIPFGAALLFHLEKQSWLIFVTVPLLLIVAALYFVWFYYQYYESTNPS